MLHDLALDPDAISFQALAWLGLWPWAQIRSGKERERKQNETEREETESRLPRNGGFSG
jgi:hypothetical protein